MSQPKKSFDWPRSQWPINEILMQALVCEGMQDDEIAKLYHVPAKLVAERREALGL